MTGAAHTVPDLSVIIPSFNTAGLLRDCLQSIAGKTWRHQPEVIVADNASTDETPAMVREEFPAVQQVRLPANRGFGGACNAGAAAATGRHLLFLNSDTQVQPEMLDRIVEAFAAQPEAGAVGCHEITMSGADAYGCFAHHTLRSGISYLTGYRWFRREGQRYLIAGWDRRDDRWVETVTGCAWAIRRDLFQQIGGFDERQYLYFEEQDVSIRVHQAGYRIRYLAGARVAHHGAATTSRLSHFARRRQWVRSFIHLRKKHGLSIHPGLDRLVLYPALVLWWVIHRLRQRPELSPAVPGGGGART